MQKFLSTTTIKHLFGVTYVNTRVSKQKKFFCFLNPHSSHIRFIGSIKKKRNPINSSFLLIPCSFSNLRSKLMRQSMLMLIYWWWLRWFCYCTKFSLYFNVPFQKNLFTPQIAACMNDFQMVKSSIVDWVQFEVGISNFQFHFSFLLLVLVHFSFLFNDLCMPISETFRIFIANIVKIEKSCCSCNKKKNKKKKRSHHKCSSKYMYDCT